MRCLTRRSRFLALCAVAAALTATGCGGRLDIAPATVNVSFDAAPLATSGATRGSAMPVNVFTTWDEYHNELTIVFPVEVAGVRIAGDGAPVSRDEPLVTAHFLDSIVTIRLAPRFFPVSYIPYVDGLVVTFDRHIPPTLTLTSYFAASDTGHRMNRGDRFLWYHVILFIPYVKHIVLLSQAWVAGLGRTGNDEVLKRGDARVGYRRLITPGEDGTIPITFVPYDEDAHERPRGGR